VALPKPWAVKLLSVAAELGVAVLNAAPYGSGILAKGPDAYARYEYGEASKEVVERVRKTEEECRQLGAPWAPPPCSSPYATRGWSRP
jgi:D-threo-aldose 1-dehydrogenase